MSKSALKLHEILLFVCEEAGAEYSEMVTKLKERKGIDVEDGLWSTNTLQSYAHENGFFYNNFEIPDTPYKKVTNAIFSEQSGLKFGKASIEKPSKPYDPKHITKGAWELAEEKSIDISKVDGTGSDGRILKKDVEKYIAKNAAPKGPRASTSAKLLAKEHSIDLTNVKPSSASGIIKKEDVQKVIDSASKGSKGSKKKKIVEPEESDSDSE